MSGTNWPGSTAACGPCGEVLVGWKLDHLSRNLAHLVNTVQDLSARGVGLWGAPPARARRVDTTTASGRIVFGHLRGEDRRAG